MSYPINYPTPQGANVQIFQAPVRPVTTAWTAEWVKPQGASFVFFTLIGAGGGTDNSGTMNDGGGSGAVTNFMCPAFLIPDILQVRVGQGASAGNTGTDTEILYQQKAGTSYLLLEAGGGNHGGIADNGGNAMSANYFTAMGFLNTVRGQAGTGGSSIPSATTFLSGGVVTSSTVTANYGYTSTKSGIFQTQPIIVGTGGSSAAPCNGGLGCGGGGTGGANQGQGGDGLAVIITW
jgi:hypothetical protein